MVAAALMIGAPAVGDTPDSALLVKDIRPGSASGEPTELAEIDGTLFFSARDGGDRELWKSDGTPAGTEQLADINPGAAIGSAPQNLTPVGDTLFFTASIEDRGFLGGELYKSDGTPGGTILVRDINGVTGDSTPLGLTDIGGTLFFSAFDGSERELWKSDGSTGGTVQVADIRPGPLSGGPSGFADVGGTAFFAATSGEDDRELWMSDGTADGTVEVADINPGDEASNPRELTDVGGTAFFTATDGQDGRELWKSDGTAAGTVQVKDLNAGVGDSDPLELTEVDGTLFFTASDGQDGRELWKSDGTAAGTVKVKDVNPGPLGSAPSELARVGGALFFAARAGGDRELWTSDGTERGTLQVANINPDASSEPQELTNVRGTLFLTAVDGSTGRELWSSDGTAAGTVPVSDIRAGAGSSSPAALTDVDGTLFVTADDGARGRELWRAVDTLAPDTTITSGPLDGERITDPNPTLAFSSDDTPSTFECRITTADSSNSLETGDDFGPCSGPGDTHTPTSPLQTGSLVTFQVRATDASGNVDPTPAERSFAVVAEDAPPADTSPPNTVITSGPNPFKLSLPLAVSGTATFSFVATEPGSTFECRMDREQFRACASPATYRVRFGAHTFAVRSRDSAGNVDATPARVQFLSTGGFAQGFGN